MRSIGRQQRFQEAMRSLETGAPERAAVILDELVSENPRDAKALVLLARSQLLLGQLESALSCARRAIKAEAGLPEAHCQLGDIERAAQRLAEADRAYREAHRLSPDHPWALKGIAEVCFLTGDTEEAERTLTPAVERHPERPAVSLAFARVCGRLGRTEQGVASLRRWLDQESVDRPSRREGWFLLGGLLDRLGRYDDAFDAYERGNALRTGSFDPTKHARSVQERIRMSANPLSPDALSRSRIESDLPVLIVGMPRSGTSLVEQIIDAHSDAHGCGELKALARIEGDLCAELHATLNPRPLTELADKAANTYLEELRDRSGTALRATDKNPFNYERLGMIDRILPGARIVHCVRDPVDTCLSCYFSNFPGETAFTNDLSHLGAYYNTHRRLMAHWSDVVQIPMTEISYEALTSDPEGEVRRLIGFLGLTWDEACLRHHESGRVTHTSSAGQADRPIYRSSVERWRHYEGRLGPLLAALENH